MSAQESFRPNDGYSRTEIDLKLQTILMEIKSEMKDLRTDTNNFRSEMKADMQALRSEVKAEINDLRSEMNTRMTVLEEKFNSQNKLIWIILGVLLSLILTIVTKSLFHLP